VQWGGGPERRVRSWGVKVGVLVLVLRCAVSVVLVPVDEAEGLWISCGRPYVEFRIVEVVVAREESFIVSALLWYLDFCRFKQARD